MKPSRFRYFSPNSAEEAVGLYSQFGDEARFLAGGQSLVPVMNMRMARPSVIVDLNRCTDLFYLRKDGDEIVSGTMTRQYAAETCELTVKHCPLLVEALRFVGHPTNRNRGTLGGSLAHADPVAELPAVAVALEARLMAQGPNGARWLTAQDFFIAELTTALQPNEMLREIRFPCVMPKHRCSFVESGNRQADIAISGIAVFLAVTETQLCESARLVAMGVGPRPSRLTSAEAILEGAVLTPSVIREAAEASKTDIQPMTDVHATAQFRRNLTARLLLRGITNAATKRGGHLSYDR